MCPKSVITSCDSQTSHEIIRNRPGCSLPMQWCPVCGNETVDRQANDEGDIEPVDVLEPVGFRDGLFGDVRFLGIVLLVAIRF